jgi:enamine deaminase RidA (YjgF/YER057c/UK114 family)
MFSTRHRREFLKQSLLIAGGAIAGSATAMVAPAWPIRTAQPGPGRPSPEERLKELKIELPPPPKPVATYTPAVLVGNLLFVSGHGPANKPDGSRYQGKVGSDLDVAQGAEAARSVGLNVLSTVRATLGSLDRVVRVVKVLGMVNATSDFTRHPQVINGFSDLMVAIFGDPAGKAARSAVGMASLPSNIPVEIEAIFEVKNQA